MYIFPLIILLIGVAIASVVLDRRYQAKQLTTSDEDGAEDSENTAPSLKDTISQVSNRVVATAQLGPRGWYDKATGHKPSEMPQHFRSWVAASKADKKLKTWIEELSPESLQAFTEHVAIFCADMGCELAWLVEENVDDTPSPELTKTVEQIVLHYCQACHKAAQEQETFDAQHALQAFVQNPSSRKSQDFGRKLFAGLVDANLASVPMAEYLMASKKEQREHMTAAIQEATAKSQAAFTQVLKAVVKGPLEAADPTATTESFTSDSVVSDSDAPATAPA
jgi:hypothetical protein